MEFKIDTKDSFTIIMPVNNRIDAKLTGALREKYAELAQKGASNFIIDLKDCVEIDSGNGELTRFKCEQPAEYIHQGVLMAIVDHNELNQTPNDTDYLQMLDIINGSFPS